MVIKSNCSICSDCYDINESVSALRCGHTFHSKCIFQWLETEQGKYCPHCRISSKVQDVIKLYFNDCEDSIVEDVSDIKNELKDVKETLLEAERKLEQNLITKRKKDLEFLNIKEEIFIVKNRLQEELLTNRELKKYLSTVEEKMQQAINQENWACKKLKELEQFKLLLIDCEEEANNIVDNTKKGDNAIEYLALYVVSLKREYENCKENKKSLKEKLVLKSKQIDKSEKEMNEMKHKYFAIQEELQCLKNENISLKKRKYSQIIDVQSSNMPSLIFESQNEPCNKEEIDTDNSFFPIADSTPKKANSFKKDSQHHTANMLTKIVQKSALFKKKPLTNSLSSANIISKPLQKCYGYDGFGGHHKIIDFRKEPLTKPKKSITKKI